MANRENLVTSSVRNQGLRQHIAATFVTAVREMCQYPQLRFRWMQFLPTATGYHVNDPFWKGFVDLLKNRILDAKVMVPYLGHGPLRTIKDLKQLPGEPTCVDRHGDPLFGDLGGQAGVYISRHYEGSDLTILREYGLSIISMGELLDRAKADLQKSTSKMKSRDTDYDWHARAAKLLNYPFLHSQKYTSSLSTVKQMPLVPLDDETWATMDDATYFPSTTSSVKIPQKLGLRLIDCDASQHPDRRGLFLSLGAVVASPEDIRKKVLQKYAQVWPTLHRSIEWIGFLYLTRPKTGEMARHYFDVSIKTCKLANVEPSNQDVYFPDDTNKYGAAQLGVNVNFLHADYLKIPTTEQGDQSTSSDDWRAWLHTFIGIRDQLRLVGSNGSKLSDEVFHVAKHVPEKFLGLIHHLWPNEGEDVLLSDKLRQQLGEIKVSCDQGTKPLATTILPAPQPKALSLRFMRSNETLPFLRLESALSEADVAGWSFLGSLGVLCSDQLAFYLEILRAIRLGENDLPEEPYRIVDLYKAIHGKCIGIAEPDREEALKNTRYASTLLCASLHLRGNLWTD